MAMCKRCWLVVAVLVLTLTGMGYKFLVMGSTTQGSDGRTALQLSPSERDLVLGEMRAFLASVQRISEGVVKDDMQQVEQAAREVGMAAQEVVPTSLVGKLPLAFKQLGFGTHRKFDQLGLDAQQLGDKEHALAQLSELMQNCVACHAAYRIEAHDDK